MGICGQPQKIVKITTYTEVIMEQLSLLELKVLDIIQENFQCRFLDVFFSTVTKLADSGIFWILLAVIFLFFKKTRKTGLMMGVALLCGLVVGNLTLKPLIGRIRPYDLNPDVTLLIGKLHDFSFPSGHTLSSFEGATVLMIRDKRFGIPAMVLAAIIALSRLYLYVHYPTDVLAGAVLGAAFGFLAVGIVNAIDKKRKELKA